MTNKTRIAWLDPSLHTRNIGDQIIADAVGRELATLIADSTEVVRLPTHTTWSATERAIARTCSLFVVGGTNLLNGNVPTYRQWKVGLRTFPIIRQRVMLLGVGWWQYQSTNSFSKRYWRGLLEGSTHSVRDEYTRSKLAEFGVKARNTSCPTMWQLPDLIEFAREPDTVVTTITDYHADPKRDSLMINSLKERYSRVVIWPQGSKDEAYISSLGVDVEMIPPSLQAFDDVLREGVDYFGTRLHAGIRALQHGCRSSIVAVDNRAIEISKDTGLTVLDSAPDLSKVDEASRLSSLNLRLPRDTITDWRNEFRKQAITPA